MLLLAIIAICQNLCPLLFYTLNEIHIRTDVYSLYTLCSLSNYCATSTMISFVCSNKPISIFQKQIVIKSGFFRAHEFVSKAWRNLSRYPLKAEAFYIVHSITKAIYMWAWAKSKYNSSWLCEVFRKLLCNECVCSHERERDIFQGSRSHINTVEPRINLRRGKVFQFFQSEWEPCEIFFKVVVLNGWTSDQFKTRKQFRVKMMRNWRIDSVPE